MAATSIPNAFSDLMQLSRECLDGATALGSSIPLLINTAGSIGSERANALITEGLYQSSLAAMTNLRGALDLARTNGRAFAFAARDWLTNFLGRNWSQAWREAGFDGNSLAIPLDEAGLATLLERLQMYFSNHAAQENVPLQITASRAGTLYTALSTARANVNAKVQECGSRKTSRNAAVDVLRRRLRGLCNELLQRIGRDDARWRQFGLNIPSAPTVPAVPADVVVNNSTPGELWVSCAPSAYATHYRFFTQRTVLDPEPVFAGRADAPVFQIAGLVVGGQYKVYVSAANEGAESRLSEPVTAIVAGEQQQAA